MNVVSMHHLLVIFLFEKKENQKENLRLSVSQHFVYHLIWADTCAFSFQEQTLYACIKDSFNS